MNICISSAGNAITSDLDPRFGRCSYFAIIDTDKDTTAIIKNEAENSGGGAGISSGQLMVEKNIEAVITGNVGPNAMNVLKAAGIDIYRGINASVEENLSKFKAGGLQKITENVPSHFGMKNKGDK